MSEPTTLSPTLWDVAQRLQIEFPGLWIKVSAQVAVFGPGDLRGYKRIFVQGLGEFNKFESVGEVIAQIRAVQGRKGDTDEHTNKS